MSAPAFEGIPDTYERFLGFEETTAGELLAIAEDVIAPTYPKRPEHLFVSGNGSWLVDAEGESFLDMTSGIAVTALGHASPIIATAISEALGRPIHLSNLYHSAPPILLARELVERSFADAVFFANSGAESVEGAIKFARKVGGPDRRGIVSFTGSFHGRTMGALAATDRPKAQAPFAPLAGDIRILPFEDESALLEITESTAAAIVEPIQGEAGIREADHDWLRALRARCDEVGALLVFDEIQCGLGRTGDLWGHEASGVTPDIMTLAKPLAGGLPIGAVLINRRVAEHLESGDHATTFGGGPLVTAAALAVVRTVAEPEFLAEVRAKGELLVRLLRGVASPLVSGVRGRGLMVGVRVTVPPAEVVAAAREEQLLVVGAAEGTVRFLPPLTVSEEELRLAVERFDRALVRLEDRREDGE